MGEAQAALPPDDSAQGKGPHGLRPEPTHLRTPSPSTRSLPFRLPATGAYAPPNATGDVVALQSVRARVNSFPTSPSPRAEPLWLCPPCCWTLPPIESFLPLTRLPAPTYTATSGRHSSKPPIPQDSLNYNSDFSLNILKTVKYICQNMCIVLIDVDKYL